MNSYEILNVEYRHAFAFIGVVGVFTDANENRALKLADQVTVT